MKCLFLKQPYAELVVKGRKTIQIRRWNTNFRGKFFIHSSKSTDNDSATLLNIDCSKLIKGAVIVFVFLYDVKRFISEEDFLADKEQHFNIKFSKPKYGFLLKNRKKLNKPIPISGQLGFFDIPTWILADV